MSNIPFYDAVVIGQGLIGSSTLYHLAEPGFKVAGIDKGDPLEASGSSGGHSKIWRLALPEGQIYVDLARDTRTILHEAKEAARELLGRYVELMRNTGYVCMQDVEKDAARVQNTNYYSDSIEMARRLNVPLTVYKDREALSQALPQFNFGANAFGFREDTGSVLFPEPCIQTMLDLAKLRGAHVYTKTEVGSFEKLENGNIHIRLSGGGQIEAKKVIVTAGAWTKQILGPLPVEQQIARQTVYWFDMENPERYSADVFPCFTHLGKKTAYGVPVVDYDGKFAGVKLAEEQYHDFHSRPSDRKTKATDQEIAEMVAYASDIFSSRVKACRHSIECEYTILKNFTYAVGMAPDTENITYAIACNGRGAKTAAAMGRALAQRLKTGKSDIDLSLFEHKKTFGDAHEVVPAEEAFPMNEVIQTISPQTPAP